jgi:hypothetical protein
VKTEARLSTERKVRDREVADEPEEKVKRHPCMKIWPSLASLKVKSDSAREKQEHHPPCCSAFGVSIRL